MNPKMLNFPEDSWSDAYCFAGLNQPRKRQRKESKVKLQFQKPTVAASRPTHQKSNKNSDKVVDQLQCESRIGTKQLNYITDSLVKKITILNEFSSDKKTSTPSQEIQEYPIVPLRMDEFANIKQKTKQQKTTIQEAFQRTCKDLSIQASSEYAQEDDTAARQECLSQHNSMQMASGPSNIFQQFLKPPPKNSCDVISLSSDSDSSSKINFSVHLRNENKYTLAPEQSKQDKLFSIPPLKLSKQPRSPDSAKIAAPTPIECKGKTGLRYQSPVPQNPLQKINRNEGNEKPKRKQNVLMKSKDRLPNEQKPKIIKQTFPVPRQPSPEYPYQQERYEPEYPNNSKESQSEPASKWNISTTETSAKNSFQPECPPSRLKFASRVPSVEFQPAVTPFKKANFYIHINLLPVSEVDLVSINQQLNDKVMGDVATNRSRVTSSPVPSKYKIANNNLKYKQERIDNFLIFDDRRQSFPRKIVEETEEEVVLKEYLKPYQQPQLRQQQQSQPEATCMAKRSWKYPVVHHPLAVERELQLQNINCDQFLQRRQRRRGEPRDVGVLSLDELVEQCYTREILSQEVYVEYVKRTSREKALRFVRLFLQGRIEEWDYEQLKITLIDHRRLAEVLVKVFPEDYVLYQPHALQREVKDFLANLYLLTSNDYTTLVDSLDAVSEVDFWKSFKVRFQEHLESPLLILPYKRSENREQVESPENIGVRWAKDGRETLYTPTEVRLMQSYRTTREKTKEEWQNGTTYIDCEQADAKSSSSSQLSSELSYYPTPYYTGKSSVKKSGKGKPRPSVHPRRVQ